MANERDRMSNDDQRENEGANQPRPGGAEERVADEPGAERMRGTGDDVDDDEFEDSEDADEEEEEEGDGTI